MDPSLHNSSFVLVNYDDKVYTSLSRYNRKMKGFEGEYSLIHNRYSNDAFFLSKFLLSHPEKPLMLLHSQNNDYKEVLNRFSRFDEQDIEKYIEEKTDKTIEQQKEQEMDKNLGQLQLAIITKMVEAQIKTIQNQKADTAADHQILLGKELGLQWVLHTIKDVTDK
jgi:hypothetical protein